MAEYKRAVCRGSYALGTACGRCERCEEERARLRGGEGAGGDVGLSPVERSRVLGDTSGIKPIQPGENASVTVPVDPGAADGHPRREIGFAAEHEPMGEWILEDKSVLRSKMILMRAERVEGVFLADGTPFYDFKFQQTMYVIPGPGTRSGEGGA
jgi:hypothetical protein